jgi:hypothetical protein
MSVAITELPQYAFMAYTKTLHLNQSNTSRAAANLQSFVLRTSVFQLLIKGVTECDDQQLIFYLRLSLKIT